MGVLGGWAFSYWRGTHVRCGDSRLKRFLVSGFDREDSPCSLKDCDYHPIYDYRVGFGKDWSRHLEHQQGAGACLIIRRGIGSTLGYPGDSGFSQKDSKFTHADPKISPGRLRICLHRFQIHSKGPKTLSKRLEI